MQTINFSTALYVANLSSPLQYLFTTHEAEGGNVNDLHLPSSLTSSPVLLRVIIEPYFGSDY